MVIELPLNAFFFFFQAEDGIRDGRVTGVQTCALPIFDASEQHEGMVAAIAFESVVKLVVFLAVGLFVTFGLYGSFGEIFAQAEASGALSRLFTIDGVAGYTSWITLTL